MILLVESVWILPSRASQRPRTVVTVGRPLRSMPNFSSSFAELVAFELVEQSLECRPKLTWSTGKLPEVEIFG